MGDLTKDLSKKEFACRCGCGLDDIDLGVVHRLQVVRDVVGIPIIIHCGCRCAKHNKKVGGEQRSFHLPENGCKAVDWSFGEGEELTLSRCGKNLLKNWSGGFKFYEEEGFIHTDVGPKRRW